MDWIWILAVIIVALFIVALCYYFFSDYTCCPCKKNTTYQRDTSQQLPYHPQRYLAPANPRPSTRYSFPHNGNHEEILPQQSHLSRYAEFMCPPVDLTSKCRRQLRDNFIITNGNVKLHFATRAIEEIIFEEDDEILALDLHHMTVEEATKATESFVSSLINSKSSFRIITGKGTHSKGGVSILKPEIEAILTSYGLGYVQTSGGGSLTVYNTNLNSFPNIW